MRFETDSYFHIGKAHINGGTPCQDYALSGNIDKNAAYAIISDGCSTGGKTDVGARILGLATAAAIDRYWKACRKISTDTPDAIGFSQRLVLESHYRESLGLQTEDLLATCLYCYATNNESYILSQGDGVAAFVLDTGIEMIKFEWQEVPMVGSVPFYPAYISDQYKGFIKIHGGDENALKLQVEHYWMSFDKTTSMQRTVKFSIKEGIDGIKIPLPETVQFVALFSDGICQIEGIDWKEAVQQALAFKTTAGDFAKRRMSRMIKDSQITGKGPIDDVSCAVIHIVNEENNES